MLYFLRPVGRPVKSGDGWGAGARGRARASLFRFHAEPEGVLVLSGEALGLLHLGLGDLVGEPTDSHLHGADHCFSLRYGTLPPKHPAIIAQVVVQGGPPLAVSARHVRVVGLNVYIVRLAEHAYGLGKWLVPSSGIPASTINLASGTVVIILLIIVPRDRASGASIAVVVKESGWGLAGASIRWGYPRQTFRAKKGRVRKWERWLLGGQRGRY